MSAVIQRFYFYIFLQSNIYLLCSPPQKTVCSMSVGLPLYSLQALWQHMCTQECCNLSILITVTGVTVVCSCCNFAIYCHFWNSHSALSPISSPGTTVVCQSVMKTVGQTAVSGAVSLILIRTWQTLTRLLCGWSTTSGSLAWTSELPQRFSSEATATPSV